MRFDRAFITSAFVLLLLTLTTSCFLEKATQAFVEEQPSAEEVANVNQEARRRLRDLVEAITAGVEDTLRRVAVATEDTELKRRTVLFRMRAIQRVRETLWAEIPVSGMIDLWTLIIQYRHYITAGDGHEMFGEHHQILVAGLSEVVEVSERLIKNGIGDEFEAARSRVYRFAEEHPIEGSSARISLQPSRSEHVKNADLLAWVPSLNPFGGVGAGISESASAIEKVSASADRFSDVVTFLPMQVSWQLELAQYDLQEANAIRTTVDAVDRVSKSTEAAVDVARDLPERIRTELESALDDLEPRLVNINRSLAEARATSESFDHAAGSLDAMAAQLDTTLKTFHRTLELLIGDPAEAQPEPSPKTPTKAFDILDYEKTAASIATMADNMQRTLQSFNEVLSSPHLAAAGNSTTESVADLIWIAVLATICVIATFFTLLLVYRRMTGT